MGKINQGILGSVSGKVGGVIGGSWKGIGYVRSIPASVADRKSTAQLEQRGKMKLLGKVSADILAEIIKPLWDRFAIRMSGYNSFVRKNMPAIVSGSLIDLTKIVISNGKMAAPDVADAQFDTGTERLVVAVTTVLPDSFSALDDRIYILVMDKIGNIYATSAGATTRQDGAVTFDLSDMSFVAADSAVYVSAIRKDGTIVSVSKYCTVVNV